MSENYGYNDKVAVAMKKFDILTDIQFDTEEEKEYFLKFYYANILCEVMGHDALIKGLDDQIKALTGNQRIAHKPSDQKYPKSTKPENSMIENVLLVFQEKAVSLRLKKNNLDPKSTQHKLIKKQIAAITWCAFIIDREKAKRIK